MCRCYGMVLWVCRVLMDGAVGVQVTKGWCCGVQVISTLHWELCSVRTRLSYTWLNEIFESQNCEILCRTRAIELTVCCNAWCTRRYLTVVCGWKLSQ